METTRMTLVTALGLAGAFVAGHAQAQDTLFRDTFDRTIGTDLNAGAGGKSGTFSTTDWVEIGLNGDASIDENPGGTLRRLVLDATGSSGLDGAVAYPDVNFSGLSSFQVEFRILTGSSGGNGRQTGFSVGQSKAELDAIAGANDGSSVGDFYVGLDYINSTQGISIRQNGVNKKFINSGTLPTEAEFGMPDTLTVFFTFDDMDAGSDLNYDVHLNGVSVDTGTHAWSGTDENYIAFHSNYTGAARLSYIDIKGVEAASLPGDTDGDGDIDDADLGTAFSNFTGPVGAAGGKTAADGDTDGDGDVDDADLANAFSGFTGPLGPASVPEPASLALLGLGGLAFAQRRRA